MNTPVKNPLQHIYAQGGFPLVEYHGALLPGRFSDPAVEHLAVRQAAGIFDFSFRARFTAKGSDRVRFLQGMVTNDVKKLDPGQGTYATMLDTRGHILFDTWIYCTLDSFILATDSDLAEKALQSLNHYNVGGRVPLQPAELWTLSFQGPASRRLVEACLQVEVPAMNEYDFIAASFAGHPATIARASSTGEEGYEVWTRREAMTGLWEQASAHAHRFGALPCGIEALETLRIEAGIPRYGQELAEDTLPLEAGLLNALSFTKGCYIGQEIVERARSRGHVNWRMAGLFVDSSQVPAVGEKLIAEGRQIGEVTSACVSPSLGRAIALAYVRREFHEPGTRLVLGSGSAAEVARLPFYSSAASQPRSQDVPATIPD
ncbi:MAG TPA: aminomethyltransferase family protein [Terriglobia bacterium]|nr:aminomethyltransferase family protein [Terriglobia bacterium]